MLFITGEDALRRGDLDDAAAGGRRKRKPSITREHGGGAPVHASASQGLRSGRLPTIIHTFKPSMTAWALVAALFTRPVFMGSRPLIHRCKYCHPATSLQFSMTPHIGLSQPHPSECNEPGSRVKLLDTWETRTVCQKLQPPVASEDVI